MLQTPRLTIARGLRNDQNGVPCVQGPPQNSYCFKNNQQVSGTVFQLIHAQIQKKIFYKILKILNNQKLNEINQDILSKLIPPLSKRWHSSLLTPIVIFSPSETTRSPGACTVISVPSSVSMYR